MPPPTITTRLCRGSGWLGEVSCLALMNEQLSLPTQVYQRQPRWASAAASGSTGGLTTGPPASAPCPDRERWHSTHRLLRRRGAESNQGWSCRLALPASHSH